MPLRAMSMTLCAAALLGAVLTGGEPSPTPAPAPSIQEQAPSNPQEVQASPLEPGASPSPSPSPTPPPKLAELVRQLEDPDWDTRMEAAIEIGRLGPAAETAVPAVQKALGDGEAAVRMRAADALGMIGPASAPASALLIAALKDADPRVRTAAARALPYLDRQDKAAAAAVEPLLADPDPDVRFAAATALAAGFRAVDKAAALPVLRERLGDQSLSRRVRAATVMIAAVGPSEAAPLVVPILREAVGSRDPWEWQDALAAAGWLGPEGMPLLLDIARDRAGDYGKRVGAIARLAMLGPKAAPAVPMLKEIVAERGKVGMAAGRAIAAIEAPPRTPPAPQAVLPAASASPMP